MNYHQNHQQIREQQAGIAFPPHNPSILSETSYPSIALEDNYFDSRATPVLYQYQYDQNSGCSNIDGNYNSFILQDQQLNSQTQYANQDYATPMSIQIPLPIYVPTPLPTPNQMMPITTPSTPISRTSGLNTPSALPTTKLDTTPVDPTIRSQVIGPDGHLYPNHPSFWESDSDCDDSSSSAIEATPSNSPTSKDKTIFDEKSHQKFRSSDTTESAIVRHHHQHGKNKRLIKLANSSFDAERLQSEESRILDTFSAKYCYSYADNTQMRFNKQYRIKFEGAGAPGEEVACKINEKTWILATVLSFDPTLRIYRLVDKENQGEFDLQSKIFLKKRKTAGYALPSNLVITAAYYDVKRLKPNDGSLPPGYYKIGDEIIAVYPDTTSFYPAIICKDFCGTQKVYVQFDDDDKDEKGIPVVRKVNIKYVISRADIDYGIYDYFLGTAVV